MRPQAIVKIYTFEYIHRILLTYVYNLVHHYRIHMDICNSKNYSGIVQKTVRQILQSLFCDISYRHHAQAYSTNTGVGCMLNRTCKFSARVYAFSYNLLLSVAASTSGCRV